MSKELSLVQFEGLNIDLDAAVMVVVSRAEERLGFDLEVAKKAIEEAQANVKVVREKRDRLYVKEANKLSAELAKKLSPVVKAAGGSVKAQKVSNNHRLDYDDGDIVSYVDVMGTTGRTYHAACFETRAKPSKELVALDKELVKAREEVSSCEQNALDIKRRLKNLPSLERKTRARIATAKLGESKEGEALLRVLQQDFENDFKALPAY